LNGDANVTHEAGSPYHDANATWVDLIDGNGTTFPAGQVNVNALGKNILVFSVTDASGNISQDMNRTVTVVDTTPPVITINGDANESHEAGLP